MQKTCMHQKETSVNHKLCLDHGNGFLTEPFCPRPPGLVTIMHLISSWVVIGPCNSQQSTSGPRLRISNGELAGTTNLLYISANVADCELDEVLELSYVFDCPAISSWGHARPPDTSNPWSGKTLPFLFAGANCVKQTLHDQGPELELFKSKLKPAQRPNVLCLLVLPWAKGTLGSYVLLRGVLVRSRNGQRHAW